MLFVIMFVILFFILISFMILFSFAAWFLNVSYMMLFLVVFCCSMLLVCDFVVKFAGQKEKTQWVLWQIKPGSGASNSAFVPAGVQSAGWGHFWALPSWPLGPCRGSPTVEEVPPSTSGSCNMRDPV